MKIIKIKKIAYSIFVLVVILFISGCGKTVPDKQMIKQVHKSDTKSEVKDKEILEVSREKMAELSPEKSIEERTLNLEEATAIVVEADNAVHDIMKSLENEEIKSKEDVHSYLERYFDETIIDYVLFIYQIIDDNGKYTYVPYAEYNNFWLDSSKEMSILSQNGEICEIGVAFFHRWKVKWDEEMVSVKLEWREDHWSITDISQWYNDFQYYYMRDVSFNPEYFTEEQAEFLIENFGTDEAGNKKLITAKVDKDGYILENSSRCLLSEEEIGGLSKYEIYLAIQEIYARHGKKFSDPVLYEHFEKQNWYKPYEQVFSKEVISEIESENIKILTEKGNLDKEADISYGSLYSVSDSQASMMTEETAACMIYHAFAMADEVISFKEENYIKEKSQDIIQFYSLGEYSEEEKLKNYLSTWFGNDVFDYLTMIYNTWTGLYRDEQGNFYISREGTYGGEKYVPYFFQKVTIKEANENKIVVEIAFYNYALPEVNMGEISFSRNGDKWLITSISNPYYDKFYNEVWTSPSN